jgi:hypothetical protein
MPGKHPSETAPVDDDAFLLPPKQEPLKAKELFKRVMIVAELLSTSQEQEPSPRWMGNAPRKTQK